MQFRPCIDLHAGIVKQIVGSTLTDTIGDRPTTNFEAKHPASHFAEIYAKDNLKGGHVIMLGANEENKSSAKSALAAFPNGMQIGGGITLENAQEYLDAGASHVIVTSYIFHDGQIDYPRLIELSQTIGKHRLVLDLSCRMQRHTTESPPTYVVVTDRWQTFTNVQINKKTLEDLAQYCEEFLIHAVDVEGKRGGIQADLVTLLGKLSPIPVTYAGGAQDLNDLDFVKTLGGNNVHLSIGSALDLFGGNIPYQEVVHWQRLQEK